MRKSELRMYITGLFAAILLAACGAGPIRAGTETSAGRLPAPAVVQIAALLTDKQVFAVTPETVSQYFAPLLALKSVLKDDHLWTFVGEEPERGILWTAADFQAGVSEDTWEFIQMQFALGPTMAQGKSTYDEVRSAITAQLGPPTYNEESEPGRRLAWSVGEYQEIALREGVFENQSIGAATAVVVLLEAIVLQGESEEP
jgi:hypothetical protein